MTQERTEFTFWPNPEELSWIAEAGVSDLIELVSDPDLLVPTFHELWRTGRTESVYEVTRLHPHVLDDFLEQAPTNIAFMVSEHGVSLESGEEFFRETLPQVLKGALRLSPTDIISEEQQNALNNVVSDAMGVVNNLIARIRARKNL